MPRAPNRRSFLTGALLAAIAAIGALAAGTAPVSAATTVARVTLEVPAAHARAAASVDIESYSLDADTDFSLVRGAAHAKPAAARVTVVLPESAPGIAFATSGSASIFAWLAIRQSDAEGATLHRTVFYNARIVRIERMGSGTGARRRLTFTANRIEGARARDPR